MLKKIIHIFMLNMALSTALYANFNGGVPFCPSGSSVGLFSEDGKTANQSNVMGKGAVCCPNSKPGLQFSYSRLDQPGRKICFYTGQWALEPVDAVCMSGYTVQSPNFNPTCTKN